MIWTIRYHGSEDRWAFDYVGELLSVGGSHFGSTIQPLEFVSAPGEFSYGELRYIIYRILTLIFLRI